MNAKLTTELNNMVKMVNFMLCVCVLGSRGKGSGEYMKTLCTFYSDFCKPKSVPKKCVHEC